MINAREASYAALIALKKKIVMEGNSPEGLTSIKHGEELKLNTAKVFAEIEKIKKELFNGVGGGVDDNTKF